MKIQIEKVTASSERDVIQFLSLSTANDPASILMFPDAVRRLFSNTKLSAAFTKMLSLFDERYIIKDGNEIAALGMWIPPGKQITNNHLIRFGFLRIPFVMGFRAFRYLTRFLDISTRIQEDFLRDRNHFLLLFLVSDPRYKQEQFMGEILSHLIKESDKKNEPIFTHCFDDNKLKFLEKHGFTPVSSIKFSESCVMHCLIKEPKVSLKKRKTKPVKSSKLKISVRKK